MKNWVLKSDEAIYLTTIKEKNIGVPRVSCWTLKGKADGRIQWFWPQCQGFFCFNEVSSLLGSSNLLSCSALFYLMSSVPSFRLQAYFYSSFFFILIYPDDFWSIDKRQFCLAFFLILCVLPYFVWKYSSQNFKTLTLNCMGHSAVTWSRGQCLFVTAV